ncbi:hypothetical protein [Sinosporangium siamense]|uniref:Uncharacterized protein n=1 Tax=Sinosporangium siamense TaxID=1367973 RepID=A0A919RJ04_9ACTN|nr:hypothetical protein [Sinosporangium siamense]GII94702.1 hypothetical protein Ssi02_49330 [Sinosporangium siamense]
MTLEELTIRYPDWVIWRGAAAAGPGGWYATRRGVFLDNEQLHAGMALTVSGDDAAGLIRELQEQQEIASRLAAVDPGVTSAAGDGT